MDSSSKIVSELEGSEVPVGMTPRSHSCVLPTISLYIHINSTSLTYAMAQIGRPLNARGLTKLSNDANR